MAGFTIVEPSKYERRIPPETVGRLTVTADELENGLGVPLLSVEDDLGRHTYVVIGMEAGGQVVFDRYDGFDGFSASVFLTDGLDRPAGWRIVESLAKSAGLMDRLEPYEEPKGPAPKYVSVPIPRSAHIRKASRRRRGR